MTNLSKARSAGLACMLGGLLFSSYFIGLNPLIRVLTPPLDPASVPALKMLVSCAAALCLAGGPVGLLALGAVGGGRRKIFGLAGAGLALLGLCSYVVGSLYIYNFPVQALKQLFTPGGSALLTLGMLLLGCVALSSRVLRGWRAAAPLLTAFYFPLQFPLQAALFLGRGRGPNPVLLGAWGIFWLLLGYAISSQARDRKATRRGPESGGADGRRGDPPDEQWAINQLIIT